VATCVGLVALISLTLGWLGWRLLMQEEALQSQQAKSRVEQSADATLAAFLRRVAETEAWINRIGPSLPAGATAAGQPAAGAILVAFSKTGIEVQPSGSLLYSPVPAVTDYVDPALFGPAERLEFQASDLNAARAALSALSGNKDPAVRAEALLRLARVQWKRGEATDALATYSKLANETRMSQADAPFALLSRFARCELLQSSQQFALAKREAASLVAALDAGTWRISKETYAWYDSGARKIAGPDARAHAPALKLAAAAAVETAWDAWQLFQRSGSRSLTTHLHSSGEAPVLTFLNANPERLISLMYAGDAVGMLLDPQARDAGSPRVSLSDEHGQLIFGTEDAGGPLRAGRSLAAAGLPWQLHVATAETGTSRQYLAERRNYLILALGIVIIIVSFACYAMARGVLREAAAGRLQSDFVSAVSHEFRSPLTTLRQLTELLSEGRIHDESRRRQYFAVLQQETSRLHQLVEDLLDFGRMDAGRRQYRLERVDFSELVRAGVDDYQSQGGTNGHRIEVATVQRQILIEADREAMGRVVRNLLENAVKYSPEAMTVWVETDCDNDAAVLRVRDEGIGIPPEEQSRIFEKFVRGEAAKKACIPGTGIGLAMVKEIVSVHHGELGLASEVGRGSTFMVRLPLSSASSATRGSLQ
jgi:signal transduction histidine kinase